MSEEILINCTPQETRVAVLENGVVQEVLLERQRKRGLVSNIYKGKVVRVLPGMDAAFVDIGLERAAFLHASDIMHGYTQAIGEESDYPDESTNQPKISDLVFLGQEIVVQVIKDTIGTKGARLTTHITVPSRYMVLLNDADSVGVSTRIEQEEERQRLKDIAELLRAEFGGSYIVRTVAEGVSEEALRTDVEFLQRLWGSIKTNTGTAQYGELIYEDLPLSLRILRDMVGDNIHRVLIDSEDEFYCLQQFASQFIPEMVGRIELYTGERPLFDLHNIEDEIEKALMRKVQLKSGGHIVIDQTEAMTTIDVNTGAYVGNRTLEETIFKTNLEAAQVITRQLRLRNLGGIIIIDFIDMVQDGHRDAVLEALEKHLARDHAKTHVSEVSPLGLVQMTRKRTRESLEHILCTPCPCCQGRGQVKSVETLCFEIFREISREAQLYQQAQGFLVLAHPEIIDLMRDEESHAVAELETEIGIPIRLQSEPLYPLETFDVVLT